MTTTQASPPPEAPKPSKEPAPIPTPHHDPAPSREKPTIEPPREPQPVEPPSHTPEPALPGTGEPTPASPPSPAPAPSPGGPSAASDLPVARGAQPDDLIVSPEAACGLVSEHGGEIVIMDDGRVVFMNASAHLVEIAAGLDPENPDLQKRLAAIEKAKARAAERPAS